MTVAEIEPICRQFCAGQAHERRACQMPSELLPLIAALQANETATLVEIGTRLGGTAVLFALAGFQVATIDRAHCLPAVREIAAEYDVSVDVIQGASADPHVVASVRGMFPSIDAVFIDGDHSLLAATQDYLTWATLVRRGGIVAFHDIVDTPTTGRVSILWEEIKHTVHGVFHEARTSRVAYGIGWYQKP